MKALRGWIGSMPFAARACIRLAIVAGLLALTAMDRLAIAGDAHQHLTQYAHTSWRMQDGIVAPNVVAQSPDGYLWIGTASGLLRFDGARFVPVNSVGDVSIQGRSIESMLFARDGSLWIGTQGSASQIRGDVLKRYEIKGRVVGLAEDSAGNIWTALTRTTAGAPLCRISSGEVTCFGPPDIPLRGANSVNVGADGDVWIGGSAGLCRWDTRTAAACYLTKELAPFAGLIGVAADMFTRDGTHWIGLAQSGKGLGLGKIVDAHWQSYVSDRFDGTSLKVAALAEDGEGSLWIGTIDQGIYRLHGTAVEHFGSADGLSGNTVGGAGIFVDREGVVWVATSEGLDSFRQQPVSVFSTREGLPADGVESVLPTREGPVWLGNWELSVVADGVSHAPSTPELFRGKGVTSMLQDHAGRIWIGLDKTLNVFENDALRPITAGDGSALGIALELAEDAADDVWAMVAGDRKIVRIHDFNVLEQLDAAVVGRPSALAPSPGGGLWLGYMNGDIALYRDGKLARIPADSVSGGGVRNIVVGTHGVVMAATTHGLLLQDGSSRKLLNIANGLPCENLGVLVQDGEGDFWLKADCGLVRVRASDLDAWMQQPAQRIRYALIDALRGVRPGTGSFTPAAKVAPDGKLWFASGAVAEVVDPGVPLVESTPAVIIEQITADRVAYAISGDVALESNTRDIDIRYTAPTSVIPQQLRFRYRLEGRDNDWEFADTRRQAFYTDLPPGNYRFVVQAARTEGDWRDLSASVAFHIPPLYYQTRWFAAACTAGLVVAVYCAFLIRLRQVEKNLRGRLKARSQERDRIARDLHDTLLQDTQALVLGFQTVADDMPPEDPARRRMEATLDRADRILADGRACVLDLRTSELTAVNLPDALSRVGEEMAQIGNQQHFSIIVDGCGVPLAAQVRDECYRIGREAILNAFRHADAKVVEVQISYSESLFSMQIRDDGKGIDQATLLAGEKVGHLGLVGMRERATEMGARFRIWSGTRPGTEIEIQIPGAIAFRTTRGHLLSKWARKMGVGLS